MDNIEANEDIRSITSSARISYADEVIQLQDTPTSAVPRLTTQTGLVQMKPDCAALNYDWKESPKSEPMDLQGQEIIALAQVHGSDPETGLTTHQAESSANHSSTSQGQSAKHNMPKFLAKNIKQLIKTQLKSKVNTQGLQELNQLYLKFVLKNLKDSLKSVNSFCFSPAQDKNDEKESQDVAEKFKEFLKKLKRHDLPTETEEEWNVIARRCPISFKAFILNNESELQQLAENRNFAQRSRNSELVAYTKRFLTQMKNDTRRGKDVKTRRSTQ